MKVFYWSPFFTKIATIQAVIKSAESLVDYEKKNKYDVSIIDAIGEWEEYKKTIDKRVNIIKILLKSFLRIVI